MPEMVVIGIAGIASHQKHPVWVLPVPERSINPAGLLYLQGTIKPCSTQSSDIVFTINVKTMVNSEHYVFLYNEQGNHGKTQNRAFLFIMQEMNITPTFLRHKSHLFTTEQDRKYGYTDHNYS